nr:SH2 domain-containing protein 5 isoform X1 [Anolis sagrei ordinatus]
MKKQVTLMEAPRGGVGVGGGGRVITKEAQYVGSFVVEEAELQQKAQAIHEQLHKLKDCPRRRPVALKFCLQGIKMYSAEKEEVLLMAHALRRIFFSTCRPADGQFAFVSRNPRSSQLFCHVFVGSQPCEVQALHLLLCRCFQLCFLRRHPETQAQPPDAQEAAAATVAPEVAGGGLLGSPVLWETLDPEEVSQNVNALVSFQRLLLSPAGLASSISVSERLDLEGQGRGRVGAPGPGNPYCSPILVRKKAIRSKILRSGAYRGCTFDVPFQPCAQETLHPTSRDNKGSNSATALSLPEDESSLMEDVWSFAGIDREAGMALLRRDVLGAFLLWAEPGSSDQWRLSVRTRCGVIPYQMYRSQVGSFSVEHLNAAFPSMEALLEHYAGTQGGLFCSLESGRVNHCFQEEEEEEEEAVVIPRGVRGRRKASWLQAGSKSLAVGL